MSRRKPDVVVRWGKRCEGERIPGEGALVYKGCSSTGGLLAHAFETTPLYSGPDSPTLAQALERNGYDLKTLRFTIRKKEPHG